MTARVTPVSYKILYIACFQVQKSGEINVKQFATIFMVAVLFNYYKHVITKYYFKFLTRK